jgi:hypothetical protein
LLAADRLWYSQTMRLLHGFGLALLLLSSTACDKLGGKKTGVVAGNATATAAPDSIKADKVKDEGGPIGTDGHPDGAITLIVDGPVLGIVLLTVDKDGKPEGGQQWDTYIGDQKVPPSIKAPFETGEPTWQLGVFEGGKLQNAGDGSLKPLPDGKHTLSLYAADSGNFDKSHHLAVFVERPDHSVVRSNLFTL